MATTPPFFRLKDPGSVEPIGMDWSDWLVEIGTSAGIASSNWAVDGPDDTLDLTFDAIATGGQQTTVYLTGGTVGGEYDVTNTIVTNTTPPVTDVRSARIKVVQR